MDMEMHDIILDRDLIIIGCAVRSVMLTLRTGIERAEVMDRILAIRGRDRGTLEFDRALVFRIMPVGERLPENDRRLECKIDARVQPVIGAGCHILDGADQRSVIRERRRPSGAYHGKSDPVIAGVRHQLSRIISVDVIHTGLQRSRRIRFSVLVEVLHSVEMHAHLHRPAAGNR